MSIYRKAVNNPVTVALIFIAFAVFGIFSLMKLSINLFPEFDSNYIMVMSSYRGASAEDVETNLSKVLENSLNGVSNLKNIPSPSKENIAVLALEFVQGVDIDEATNDVRDKLDLVKKGIESSWNINEDRTMQALALTFSEQPMAMNMSFQRQYAERYDWLAAQFKDWAFHLLTSFFYYEDNASLKDEAKKTLHMSMAAFGGMAPTYHIALFDKPTIVWDFHSLLLGIQMMFSFMLTDEDSPLRLCKHCQKVFAASRQSNLFCSPKCKNQYNVYKSRKKNK